MHILPIASFLNIGQNKSVRMSHYSDKHYTVDKDFDKFYYGILFKKGDKIVDIGCSTGNFALQDPKNIIGIDVDEDALKIARKFGLKVIKQDVAGKLPFKGSTVENVNCRHVLEHLDSTLHFMKDIFRILKKNGRLVLITDEPAYHFWDDYTHKRPFTVKSLEQLLYDAGFKNFRVSHFPQQGVFGLGLLYRHKMVSPGLAKKIYLLFGKLSKKSLIIEAFK